MISITTSLRVRYSETDQMGYVYYGNYAQYFEIGRVEIFRQLGASYKQIEENNCMLPVIDLYIKYIKPALYDDELFITTSISELPNVRIKFNYEITNTNNELLCIGNTSLAFIDKNTRKIQKCPNEILELLKKYF